ncbi:hypothetical protein ANANG_G00177160 [Anguilla anguilla]|uniref:PEHE domain-containing protein n=1 Tax=Anguilla anguilla TaxID=7936 RepID=A0A9D3M4J5_ANGAN|nr:hypothetical protein ANANG_G00177160 [Anguilla anguilla]
MDIIGEAAARPLGGHKGLPDGQEGQSGSGAQACGVVSSHAIGRKGPERHTNSIVQNDSIQVPKEQTVEQNGVELTQNNATGVCGDPAEGTALGAERVPVETLSAEALEAGASQAQHRQGQLEERTERLWRRLQVVQVKQMERHVVQQLQGLAGAMGPRREGGRARLQQASRPPHMPSSGELSRLARSCSEALRTAEGALDSDHTASSSGGESESEERDGDSTPAWKNTIQNSTEWQWAKCRAGLGSRWVWLQAQVSELEYRIRALTELYTHLRQGKGRGVLQPTSSPPLPVTPLRASRPSHPPNSSLCSASELPQNALRKKPTEESPHPPRTPGSPFRCQGPPLLRQRRRKLIRLGGSVPLAAKAVSVQCCGPSWTSVCTPSCPFPLTCPWRCGVESRRGPAPAPTNPHGRRGCRLPLLAGQAGPGLPEARQAEEKTSLRPPAARHPPPCPRQNRRRPQRGLVNLPFLCQRTCSTDLTFRPATPPAPDTPTQPTRRRRGESSFDIDNLVMPLGLAGLGGGARVQKLQYKEILTPSWRQLDSPSAVPAGQVPPALIPLKRSRGPLQSRSRRRSRRKRRWKIFRTLPSCAGTRSVSRGREVAGAAGHSVGVGAGPPIAVTGNWAPGRPSSPPHPNPGPACLQTVARGLQVRRRLPAPPALWRSPPSSLWRRSSWRRCHGSAGRSRCQRQSCSGCRRKRKKSTRRTLAPPAPAARALTRASPWAAWSSPPSPSCPRHHQSARKHIVRCAFVLLLVCWFCGATQHPVCQENPPSPRTPLP